MPTEKIVLLAGAGRSTNVVFNYLARRFPIASVILEDPVPRFEFLRRRGRRLGWRKVIGQMLFRTTVVPYLELRSRARIREICRGSGLDEKPVPDSLVARVPSVNSQDCTALLGRLNPAVVVISGTRIISEQVLQSVPAWFINMHVGITPMYRGVHGAYWALVQNDGTHCGVTVHLVDNGIDTGKVLAQATCSPGPQDNFATYIYLQLAAGLPLLERAVEDTLAGRLQPLSYPAGPSKLWSHPTLADYIRHRLAQGVK